MSGPLKNVEGCGLNSVNFSSVTTTHVSLTFEGRHSEGLLYGCHFDGPFKGEHLDGERPVSHFDGSQKGDHFDLLKGDHFEGSCDKIVKGFWDLETIGIKPEETLNENSLLDNIKMNEKENR